ncbi:hypothetical protein [Muricoccus pecuniae]|uniref:Uncharacterized protein n=1 Tax=Muricoccus pecuniae TaxID=693023 RepID=A0A840YCU6_9PROT|nr:hypothetical protein [Roseomonas pecuniae]MBB5696509.1 hypothetical protein [Roseomonas pecuniae]
MTKHHENHPESGSAASDPGRAEPLAPSAVAPGALPASGTTPGSVPPAEQHGSHWRDPILVVGRDWLGQFAPTQDTGLPSAEMPDGSNEEEDRHLFAARLRSSPGTGRPPIARLTHPELRRLALMASCLLAWTADGQAVAALVGVPEASTSRLHDDVGSARAVARLAVTLGVAPDPWPAEMPERVRLLLTVLHLGGGHPDAPARPARLAAWSLALNADANAPIPLSTAESHLYARMAGLASEAIGGGQAKDTGEAWPPTRLSQEEQAEIPDDQATRRLFIEAGRAHARLAAAEAAAPTPATPGEG